MLPRAEESRLESSRSDAEQKSSVGLLDADETGNKLSNCYGDRGCFLCRLSYASREFPVDPASAHVTRHCSGFERSRHAQSVDRAELRRADEAHPSAANRCRPSRSCPSFSFRIPVVSCRPLFGPDRADRGELACAADVRLIFISLHAAQTANANLHLRRSVLRCYASADRIRRREREARLFLMAALRDSFPLAILAFHGDCVDVSRGLREGRIPGTSAGARKIQTRGMAERTPPLALIPITVASLILQQANQLRVVATLLLSLSFLYFAARLAGIRSNGSARQLLLVSVVYLPLVFLLHVLARV